MSRLATERSLLILGFTPGTSNALPRLGDYHSHFIEALQIHKLRVTRLGPELQGTGVLYYLVDFLQEGGVRRTHHVLEGRL